MLQSKHHSIYNFLYFLKQFFLKTGNKTNTKKLTLDTNLMVIYICHQHNPTMLLVETHENV